MDTLLLRQSIRTFAKISFSRSGGPGGQNVNKVNTKVTLRIKLVDMEGLSEAERDRLSERLASRITEAGELIINSSEERSQQINLERAYLRAEALIAASARLSKRRRPRKPSRTARERRLKTKRLHGAKKAIRRFPIEE